MSAKSATMTRSLSRLLRPSSIAVIGGKWAEAVIVSCRDFNFQGKIFPVHPSKKTIAGYEVYPDIESLPEAPDAVFLGVNRDTTIELVRELASCGAGGVVAFASGFAESEDGRERQYQLIEAAGDMPILGPNCYGMINYLDGALLWPDVQGGKEVARGVAIITQSSNLAINLTMQQGGLPIGYMLTLGNQAMIGMEEIIRVLADDHRVTAIGLHIEGIRNATSMASAARYAKSKGKNLIALKAGVSDAAKHMTISHTASLAGNAAVASSFFSAIGVGEVASVESFLQSLTLLHCFGRVDDGSLMTLSCSGGEAALVADAAERAGVFMPPLKKADIARIKKTVNPLVNISNPFDYHTFDWGDGERLTDTFTAAMHSRIGLTALIIDFPRPGLGRTKAWQEALDALVTARDTTGGPTLVLASIVDGLPEHYAHWLIERDIAPLRGFDHAMQAINAAVAASTPPSDFMPTGLNTDNARPVSTPISIIDEARAKKLLKTHGLAIPSGGVASSVEEAIALTQNKPVVMKAVSADLTHKTEHNALRLNIIGEKQIREAWRELVEISAFILVEDMITDVVAEIIIGVGRDDVIGLYLMIGAGGVMAEISRDVATLMIPSLPETIAAAIDGLAVADLLDGWRGQPKADRQSVIDAIMKVQKFAYENQHRLIEMDINPLMVRSEGKTAIVADALIRMHEQ